jgi:hypothetical protein
MTVDDEPPRWADDGTDALLARLSRAGRADGPSKRALRTAPVAVAALLLSSAPLAASAAEAGGAAGALATKQALTPLLLLKWVAIGALGSSSALALVRAPELLRSTPSVPAARAPRPKPRAVASEPRAAHRVLTAEPEPDLEPDSAAPLTAPSTPRTDVAREIALLDSARAALLAGDAGKALRLLHALDQLSARALVPEATVLRVRALLASGRLTEAQHVAERFYRSAPHAPQASVLRALLAKCETQAPR